MEVTGWLAAASAVWLVVGMARARAGRWRSFSERHGSERPAGLVLHRLLYGEPDGTWTWRVRGAKVVASRATDVCLPIEPEAKASYCPDCLTGTVRWDAPAETPRALECRACGSRFVLAILDRC